MITAGFDIGTRFVKVCIADGLTIVGSAMNEAGRDISKIIKETYFEALDSASVKKRGITKCVATGYGSGLVRYASYTLPVAPCIARAIYMLNKDIRVVIDTGGLFITILGIDAAGHLEDAIINDPCAAGSGRFLEMASSAIGIPLLEVSDYALSADNIYKIRSSCAVFSESEIVSQVNAGMKSGDVIAGVVRSIASRTVTLLNKIESSGGITLTGGVSKIEAFRVFFEKLVKKSTLDLPIDPQIITAYGAALLAQGRSV